MPLFYAFKHLFRSWTLFLALLLGIVLASAFFAGLDIKANSTAKQAVDSQLKGIYVDMSASTQLTTLNSLINAKNSVMTIQGVTSAEVRTSAYGNSLFGDPPEVLSYLAVAGIEPDSHAYHGWLNRPASLGENETYIFSPSESVYNLTVGDILPVNFSVYNPSTYRTIDVTYNLTYKGIATLNDEATQIITGFYYRSYNQAPYYGGMPVLIVDLNSTMLKINNVLRTINTSSTSVTAELLFYIDRNALINPWDIQTSITNVRSLQSQISNKINTLGVSAFVQNNLESALATLTISTLAIRFSLILVSMPVFFMAWYMGTTVSDVSFNLRRREIGLLSTKGFSSGQILRIFITQTLLLGVAGGLLGVLLGFVLNPIFTQFSTSLLDFQLISSYTITLTVIFGALIAFLSTYSSAKKASRLNTVDALREYLPTEDAKAYRKRTAWLAFILGGYKTIVFALGINMTAVLTQTVFTSGGNFIIALLGGLWMLIDVILTFIGPLLFFWGFTKILIQGSLKFQEVVTKLATFLGDLGTLATKNVRRNPARSAAVAFLIALIIGYAAQVTIQLASENDYAVRNIYYQVGADISIPLISTTDSQTICDAITGNVSASIDSTTIEYTTTTGANIGSYSMTLKAVQPASWPKTAYYENEWFSGADITSAFNEMANNKNTILLDRAAAQYLDVEIGDNVTVDSTVVRIVGFYGLPRTESIIGLPNQYQPYISIIPQQLLADLDSAGTSARILLKLKQGADGETVANNIRALNLNTGQISSFAEEYKKAQSNVIVYGATDAQRLGVVFAVLAASVGTGLVSVVSMKERSREAAMMSVKGLSYKQLLVMFLTENLAVVIFSTILGLIIGLIAAYGSISSGNMLFASVSFGSFIQRRFILPFGSALFLAGCFALVFASTIIPITIMTRKYVTELERMVRTR